jgi:AcrR family transcriptional regulator
VSNSPRVSSTGVKSAASTDGRIYGGKSPAERREARLERLLEAGLELFGTRGYADSSVKAVCTEAGLTERYFYEHFRDRPALLLAVYERVAAQLLGAVVEATLAAPPDLELRVRAGFGALIDVFEQDPRRARIQMIEVVGKGGEIEQRAREVRHAFADFINSMATELVPRPDLDEVDRRLGTLGLVAAGTELTAEWVMGVLDVSRDRLVDHIARLFVAAANAPGTRS